MYINIISNGKYKYVYINESYRENGKTKTRHVQKVGRYDLLEAKDPNFLEKLKAQYADIARSDEDVLSLALFEQVATKFLTEKYNPKPEVEVEEFEMFI